MPRARGRRLDQFAWVWDAALYGLLGLILAIALLDPGTAGQRWLLAGLTALLVGWHLGFQRFGIGDDRTWLVLVYLVGLVSIWFVLAGIHPAYFSLLLVLYPQIFRYLRLPLAIPAAVAAGGWPPGRAPAAGPRHPRHPGPGVRQHRPPAPGGRGRAARRSRRGPGHLERARRTARTTWPRPGGRSGTCGPRPCGRRRWARPWAG